MCLRLIYIVLLVTSVASRHLPHFSELDDDERRLMRAAYDAPSYNAPSYGQEYEDDLQPGKLDLVKDGLWALKAKIKELTAFNKALAANMLATKLSLKDLLKNGLVTLKTHSHEKPSYPAPAYHAPAPAYPQYEAPPAPYVPAPAPYAPAPAPYAPAPAPYAHDPYAAPPAPQYRHDHDPYYGH